MQGWDDFQDLHGHVLLVSQDGIVGLELVLLKKLFSIVDLDIQERVFHNNKLVAHSVYQSMKK